MHPRRHGNALTLSACFVCGSTIWGWCCIRLTNTTGTEYPCHCMIFARKVCRAFFRVWISSTLGKVTGSRHTPSTGFATPYCGLKQDQDISCDPRSIWLVYVLYLRTVYSMSWAYLLSLVEIHVVWPPSSYQHKFNIRRARFELMLDLGRPATDAEVAAKVGLGQDRFRDIVRSNMRTRSLHERSRVTGEEHIENFPDLECMESKLWRSPGDASLRLGMDDVVGPTRFPSLPWSTLCSWNLSVAPVFGAGEQAWPCFQVVLKLLTFSGSLITPRRCLQLDSLKPKESIVIRQRFGLDGKGERSLGEIGRNLNLSREMVRRYEARGLLKLKHPTRVNYLRSYLSV